MSLEVWVGLGSNLGDRQANLKFAVHHLGEFGSIGRLSDIYETEPWGLKDQPTFLNAVVSVYPETPDPLSFYLRLCDIELEAGRRLTQRWGPRVLDLDLLFWGVTRIETEQIVIPHPQVAERRFVLLPLAQVAPDLIHPVLGCTISELLRRCPDTGEVKSWGTFSP